jgi:AcrR family transcriptional regulator
MIPPTTARSRNAAATRCTILEAARRRFALESYDNVGLREIAGDAGVDPALIGRYFGGKEQLFREVLRGDKQPIMQDVEPRDFAEHLATLLMQKMDDVCGNEADRTQQLLILLRSASSPKAAEIIRESMNEDVLRPVASALVGADAEVRAALCLAILMGTGILRSSLALGALSNPDPEVLRERLVRLFEAALQ